MPPKISQRLLKIVEALPLKKGMRVLEIGCGPGTAAREIANRVEDVYVLAIDRSEKAIEQAKKNSKPEIDSGKLKFIQAKIEEFELPQTEELYDVAFAVRVGALDGRHPEIKLKALKNISNALNDNGKLFIDGGTPLKEINLNKRPGTKR